MKVFLISVVYFFLLLISIGVISPSEVGKKPTEQKQTQAMSPTTKPTAFLTTAPQPTATPTQPLTLKERIKAKLKLDGDTKVTVISTESDADPITDKELPGKIAVLISYHLNGTYLDTSWTKRGSWNIDTGIIQDIFPLDNSINTIVMIAQVPVTTAYGKDTNSMLDTVTIRKESYLQIHFAKFDSQNLPSIADHYVENHNIKD